MKKQILLIAALASFGYTQAQNIPQNQVPSVVLSSFNTSFPKAQDVEWEMENGLYNVEFETGWNIDHDVWYNDTGKMVKHKEDISPKDLPKSVNQTIKKEFSQYSIDDLKRITEGSKVVYKMEFESLMGQDWKVVIDANGKILSKVAD